MVVTTEDAHEILNLALGASKLDVIENYKNLALKWHPDKNKRSEESYEIFKKLCCAYKSLQFPDQEYQLEQLNESQMFNIFEEVFLSNGTKHDSSSNTDISSEEENYDYETGLHNENQFDELLNINSQDDKNSKPTQEEAQKNADILLAEEEKEKRKIEKRKAKKKRRRQKRKLEKTPAPQQNTENDDSEKMSENKNDLNARYSETSSDSEEELDPNCAFVANVANKNKSNLTNKSKPEKPVASNNETQSGTGNQSSANPNNPLILQSHKLAIRANQMASEGNFIASIELFSEAIKLNPNDFRFYGNRSYCYDTQQQFDKALKDAEKAISLNAEWPKNYYRKGKALAGLKKFADAETAFKEALKLDSTCKDAEQELFNVYTERIVELGFPRAQAIKSLQDYKTLEAALESLFSKARGASHLASQGDMYVSDDEDSPLKNKRNAFLPKPTDIKMDPSNPEGFHTIWVGNVTPDITSNELTNMFSRFGVIDSIRILPEKFCAFINYKNKESAGAAMRAMQGFSGRHLKFLIRFPNKQPVTLSTQVKKKPTDGKLTNQGTGKLVAPVNGNECYFWRQGSCIHGSDCRYKHIAANKGIDKLPQRPY